MRVRGVLVATVLAVVACGGAPTREFPAATLAQVEHVEAFLKKGYGYSLRNTYTAPVEGGAGHFVAAEIVTSGGYVGVWWHGGTPDDPGLTLAVSNIADEACVCPWVETTGSPIRMSTAPAEELKRFVERSMR